MLLEMIITGVNELGDGVAGGAGGTVGWVCDILVLLQRWSKDVFVILFVFLNFILQGPNWSIT